jgi:hypothetical protein
LCLRRLILTLMILILVFLVWLFSYCSSLIMYLLKTSLVDYHHWGELNIRLTLYPEFRFLTIQPIEATSMRRSSFNGKKMSWWWRGTFMRVWALLLCQCHLCLKRMEHRGCMSTVVSSTT